MKNRPPSLSYSFSSPNYFAPLTGRVDKPNQNHEVLHSIVLQIGDKRRTQRISFKLASNHKDKNSAIWRQQQIFSSKKYSKSTTESTTRQQIFSSKEYSKSTTESTTENSKKCSKSTTEIRAGVLDGSIPSAVSDTGATASAFTPDDPSIPTGVKSTSTFGGAFGDQAKATTINKLHHKLREPARSVHIVPQVQTSLLSTS